MKNVVKLSCLDIGCITTAIKSFDTSGEIVCMTLQDASWASAGLPEFTHPSVVMIAGMMKLGPNIFSSVSTRTLLK